jgi:Ca-activated chloride channel homolog
MAMVEIDPVELETESSTHKEAFAKLRMHYQVPGDNKNRVEEFDVPYYFEPFNDIPNYYRFAASVALFGGLLKKSTYTQKTSWDELELIAKASYDPNNVAQAEYILLIDKAKKIYHRERKKKKGMEN